MYTVTTYKNFQKPTSIYLKYHEQNKCLGYEDFRDQIFRNVHKKCPVKTPIIKRKTALLVKSSPDIDKSLKINLHIWHREDKSITLINNYWWP